MKVFFALKIRKFILKADILDLVVKSKLLNKVQFIIVDRFFNTYTNIITKNIYYLLIFFIIVSLSSL